MACCKKIFILFIIFIILFSFFSITFGAYQEVEDIQAEILQTYDNAESKFTQFCYYIYTQAYGVGNSFWYGSLMPIISDIVSNNRNTFISVEFNSTGVTFILSRYDINSAYTDSTRNWISRVSGTSYPVTYRILTNNKPVRIIYDFSTNTGSVSSVSSDTAMPYVMYYHRSQEFADFLNKYEIGDLNISDYLLEIKNYLQNLSPTFTVDVINELQDISYYLSVISGTTSPDYTQDLSDISSQISGILSSNSTIINQNSQMLQQEQNINNNLNTVNNNLNSVNNNLEDLNDNIMDDNFDNSILNLPTDNTQNSADSGINNIFSNMYNAFCTGVAQDIILPIPFTNKSITIEPDFLYNSLYNSNANWLILFIQAFWGYLISRFIVLDINDKFNKIKSGNIENLENSNIKGDLL